MNDNSWGNLTTLPHNGSYPPTQSHDYIKMVGPLAVVSNLRTGPKRTGLVTYKIRTYADRTII